MSQHNKSEKKKLEAQYRVGVYQSHNRKKSIISIFG